MAADLSTLLLGTVSPCGKLADSELGFCCHHCFFILFYYICSSLLVTGHRGSRWRKAGCGGHLLCPQVPSMVSSLQERSLGRWEVPGEGSPRCRQGAGFGGTLSPMAIVGQTVFRPGPRSDGGSCRCVQREPQNLSPPGPLPLDSWAGGRKQPPSFRSRLWAPQMVGTRSAGLGRGGTRPHDSAVLLLNEPGWGAMGTSLPEQVEFYRPLDH